MKTMEDIMLHTAQLAHIKLRDEEAARIKSDFEKILEYIDTINTLDLEEAEIMAGASDAENNLRGDKAGRSLSQEAALQNAPAEDGRFFVVPKTV